MVRLEGKGKRSLLKTAFNSLIKYELRFAARSINCEVTNLFILPEVNIKLRIYLLTLKAQICA